MLQNQKLVIPSNQLKIGISWDLIEKIDLDCQCVLLNDLGQVEDAVYYNQQKSKCGNVQHSGDIQNGEKQGFDEEINFELNKLSMDIKYIAILICSYNGESFKNVESGSASIICDGNITLLELSIFQYQDAQTVLIGFLVKNNNQWEIFNSSQPGNGKNFMESENLIKSNLKNVGFDEMLLKETKNWSQSSGTSFKMQKDQTIFIPNDIKSLELGLGWDSQCDIDSSVSLRDQDKQIDLVYYGKKYSQGVQHSGDDRTGDGSGDDETIKINFDQIPSNVTQLWCFITIYSSNKSFSQVHGAYARLLVGKKEFCKFLLSNNKDGKSNSNVICKIQRQQQQWSIKTLGYFAQDVRMPTQMDPLITNIIQNNLSGFTILDNNNSNEQIKKKLLNLKNIQVKIVKAENLGAFDSNGLSDPYVKVKTQSKKFFKTQCIKKNLNPEFNEEFTMYCQQNEDIMFNVYDYDFMMSDDFMGQAIIKYQELDSKQFVLPLANKRSSSSINDRIKGSITVQLKLLQ